MADNYTSLEDSPQMQKHFETAGIEVGPPENEGEENNQDGASTESGNSDAGANETNKVEGDAGKDSLSSKPDGDKKPGKEKEPKVSDNPGDLKLQDGTVVKAGNERRHYEAGQIARHRLTLAQNELNTTKQRFDTLTTQHNTLKETVKAIGLESPEEVSGAVKLYKDLNRDPVGTVQKLLAEVKALGHNIDGIGSGVDTAAIHQILDQRLGKSSEEPKGLTQEQINQQAAEEVTTFLNTFPDAVTHEQHIAALMDRAAATGKQLSLQDAYFMFKERVVNDGYDWTKPLGPQIEARKTPAPATPKPRVNGRVNAEADKIDPSKVVNPERELDSDSIVMAAMKEAGYNLNR